LATSSGHVAAAARIPATKPPEKFAPRMQGALASSPTSPRILLRICTKQQEKVAPSWTYVQEQYIKDIVLYPLKRFEGMITHWLES
jgi:hypothetical protein